MAERRFSEETINYWAEHLCGEADSVYRLTMGLGRNKNVARKILVDLYRLMAADAENLGRKPHPTATVLARCWDYYKKTEVVEPQADPGEVSLMLQGIGIEGRAMLSTVDVVGLDAVEAAQVFGWDEPKARKYLAGARMKLCKSTASGDADLLFGYVAEYLDGELPASVKSAYEALVAVPANKAAVDRFQVERGKFQMALSDYRLKPEERARLHEMVEDRTVRETQEAQNIDQMGRSVSIMNVRRVVIIAAVLAILIGGGAYLYSLMYSEPERPAFDATEYLAFQAQTIEEEGESDFGLPTQDMAEIGAYFKSYPQLGFTVPLLTGLPVEWKPEGASVIDFEVALVTMVQYAGPNGEKLFHFAYKGSLSDLPKVPEQGNFQGLIYQTYASEKLNMIAWKASKDVVGFLVGHRNAPELASLAKQGGGR